MDALTDRAMPGSPRMTPRPLGRTGLLVSPIGLGTVKLGRNRGVKYPVPFELPTDEQAHALLASAAELGVRLIDTAPAYGMSEERLGTLFSRAGWFGARSHWILSTKAGEEFHQGVSRFDFSAAAITASVERSLQRLRTESLDVVLLHSSGDDAAIIRDGQAIDALSALKRAGKVRAIGMSTKTVEGGLLALGSLDSAHATAPTMPWCDVLMVTLNQSDTSQLPVIREAGRRGVGILIKKALESGHVSVGSSHPGPDADPHHPSPRATPVPDPFEQALRFVLTQGGDAISSVIGGTLNPAHLAQNVRAVQAITAPEQ